MPSSRHSHRRSPRPSGGSRPKTTLFQRVLSRLIFPLFFLAAVVSAIQLTNQVQAMNRYHKLEGRLFFQTLRQALEKELTVPGADTAAMEARIRGLLEFDQKVNFDLFNFYDQNFLIRSGEPWEAEDRQAAEKSLYYKKEQNRPYMVRVDKEDKRLTAYLPFEISGSGQIWIARAYYPLGQIEDALLQSKGTLASLLLLILLTGFFIGRGLAKSIVKPIQTLHEATQAIMKGELGKKVQIRTGDELQVLAETFNHMSDALLGMKSSAEDSNPLSGLPGNNGIKQNLQRRIMERQKFVVFHSDLDRFKTFNDKYGLAKGDEAIKRTADLMKKVVKEKGSKDDFIGHQGGDDFMVICRLDKAEQVADTIIKRFDAEVVKPIYPKEDYERGYTVALDRRGMAERGENKAIEKRFPLLGLSLAGVSNAKRDFASYEDVLDRAVPVKKSVKSVVESSYEIQE